MGGVSESESSCEGGYAKGRCEGGLGLEVMFASAVWRSETIVHTQLFPVWDCTALDKATSRYVGYHYDGWALSRRSGERSI